MEELTRGQELYIRHISLFGNLVPLTIKAVIRQLVHKRGKSLSTILEEKKEHIQTFYNDLYKVLFDVSKTSIDERLDSFGITTLCDICFVLTEQPNVDYIKCILDQRRDLDKYAKIASLDFQTFGTKYTALKQSLLELFKEADDSYECRRLIHSFDESQAIQIRNEVYKSLRLSEDVDKHIELVTECESKQETPIKEREYLTAKCDDVPTLKFVQQLSDTILRSGESSALVCVLNKENCKNVEWSKNDEILVETETVYSLADKGRHCLVFARAMPEESGTYKCTYNDLSTSASLIISEQEVIIEIPLHNECDGDILEYMKVVLSCTINLTGKTPRWFHYDKEIKASNAKVTIESKDYEHKLIIDCIETDDSGEYMAVFDGATSKTSISVKGLAYVTIKQHIKQKLYQNWIIGVLGLKYLKLGLEKPAEEDVKTHHENILKGLSQLVADEKCSKCNADNLLPLHDKKQCPRTKTRHKCPCSKSSYSRRHCPSNGLCSEIYDMIVRDHRFEDPAMRNAKMGQWKSDQWSVAACYINSTEFTHNTTHSYKQSSTELDCAELLSLFVNNKTYRRNTNYGVFDMARTHRNELMHNPNYELSDDKLQEYLKDFRDVLEVKDICKAMVFGNYPDVQQSLNALKELQHFDINFCTKEELDKMKKEVRDAVMSEAAEKLADAMKQKDVEFQQMQKKLQNDCHSLMENECREHEGEMKSWYCMQHGKLICQSCRENEHRLCSGLMKLTKSFEECSKISVMHIASHNLSDDQKCKIGAICTIPGDECLVLLEHSPERGNEKEIYELLKLDKNYRPISDCVLEDRSLGMCYIGDNKVVSIVGQSLEFIGVAPLQILRRQKIDYALKGLACHGDIIYACDNKDVLRCSTNGKEMRTLCSLPDVNVNKCEEFINCKLAVSNDGEIICLQIGCFLHMINSSNGVNFYTNLPELSNFNHFIGFKKTWGPKMLKRVLRVGQPLCMRYTKVGQVIIFDNMGRVLKANDSGIYKVLEVPLKSKFLSSACFDTINSRLLVGERNSIHVYDFKTS